MKTQKNITTPDRPFVWVEEQILSHTEARIMYNLISHTKKCNIYTYPETWATWYKRWGFYSESLQKNRKAAWKHLARLKKQNYIDWIKHENGKIEFKLFYPNSNTVKKTVVLPKQKDESESSQTNKVPSLVVMDMN